MSEERAPIYRILILGAGGFVGSHLRPALANRFGDSVQTIATSKTGSNSNRLRELNVLDTALLADALLEVQPTHVINLAGLSVISKSRDHLDLAWKLHARAPEAIGQLILKHVPDCWLINVGSGLVYGRAGFGGKPMTERSIVDPNDPYTVTRAAGDMALGALAQEGLKCLRLRPFNHTGPGQREDFVVPAFAAQLTRIAMGEQPPLLKVGNLDVARDFLDVRDVVAAYIRLVELADGLKPGAIYNVSSGRSVLIRDVLETLIRLSEQNVSVESDADRRRSGDTPDNCGSAEALMRDTGWKPKYKLERTLGDILTEFRTRFGADNAN